MERINIKELHKRNKHHYVTTTRIVTINPEWQIDKVKDEEGQELWSLEIDSECKSKTDYLFQCSCDLRNYRLSMDRSKDDYIFIKCPKCQKEISPFVRLD